MTALPKIFESKDFHHAYLLTGNLDFWKTGLTTELKKYFNLEFLTSSPDIWWRDYDSFGLKDAQRLIELEIRRSFGKFGRFFILEISSITTEAQNALLKTFEEPASDVHFFIMARSEEIFLPTFLSRLIVLSVNDNQITDQGAREFIKADLPDRLNFIQNRFLKNRERSKGEIINFVANLEKILREQINLTQASEEEKLALQEIINCQRHLQNQRVSVRLILEHLALVLPV